MSSKKSSPPAPVSVERSKTPSTPIFLGLYAHDGRPGCSGVMLTLDRAKEITNALNYVICEIEAEQPGATK